MQLFSRFRFLAHCAFTYLWLWKIVKEVKNVKNVLNPLPCTHWSMLSLNMTEDPNVLHTGPASQSPYALVAWWRHRRSVVSSRKSVWSERSSLRSSVLWVAENGYAYSAANVRVLLRSTETHRPRRRQQRPPCSAARKEAASSPVRVVVPTFLYERN